MQRFKKYSLVLILAMVLAMLPLFNLGSFAESDSDVTVLDHQLIVQEVGTNGEIDSAQVIDWLALEGDGTVTIERESGPDDDMSIQGIRGFKTPSVTDGVLTWKDVRVDGFQTMITTNKLSEQGIDATLADIPLELEWSFWLDGEKYEDVADMAGKDGHFEMELEMTNVSEEETEVEYTSSITGEEMIEEVETYLPIVIQPYDWYFDNDVFFNLECDPTGIVFYMPTMYQVGWSVPLFPPATEASHTISVEADVKNFQMEPLTLAIAFLFPHTNQVDTIPEFQAGLTELYGGVVQLGSGLSEAVMGIGSTGMSDTLLYGISEVSGGLGQLVAPDGLPYASSNIGGKMIPGVNEAIAGIGGPETPDTLLYGANAITAGLNQIAAGIGTAETPDTLLYGSNAIYQGLQQMQGVIGSQTTPDTLLYGANSVLMGLSTGDPANPGVKEGVQEIINQIGSQTTPGTLLNYLATISGLCDPANPAGLPVELATLEGTILANVYPELVAGGGGLYDYVSGLAVPGDISAAAQTQILTDLATIKGTLDVALNPVGGMQIQIGTVKAIADGMIANLQALVAPGGDLQVLLAGIGSPTAKDTLIYGVTQLVGGLTALNSAIGDVSTPETLAYAANAVTTGLTDLLTGIGSPTTPDTLLYGANSVYGGLSLMKGSLSTGSMANPGLKEGLQQLETGIDEAIAGVGSPGTANTLLWGTSQVQGGLDELKAGLEGAVNEGTDVMQEGLEENIEELDLTQGELEAIELRGEQFDTFLGRIDQPSDAESNVRLIVQTKPVQSKTASNGWLIALIISIIAAIAMVLMGLFAWKKFA